MQTSTITAVMILILKIVGWLFIAATIVWVFWRTLKNSRDPKDLITKWVLTIPGLGGLIALYCYLYEKVNYGVDYGVAFFGGVGVVACGLYLGIIWGTTICKKLASPLTSLIDGGEREADPQAFYSAAISKRKRGNFTEAVAEIRRQLEKFPTDYTGQMLLAEIQAENLNDMPGAELTIHRLCNQPGINERNVVSALNTLADWHLKYSVDPDAARAELQRIVDKFPGSEAALMAEHRIGHLADKNFLAGAHDRPRIHLPHGENNVGLMTSSAHLAPSEIDQAKRASELTAHLQQHPQDTEAREQLAFIYADFYKRLDLAADQLGQLINQPNQPARNVIRWLNLLADLQVRHNCSYDAVATTLSQIIERYPNQATAGIARNRLDLLRLEMKSKSATRPVKIGTYEQNIGLKHGPPGGAR